MLNSVNSANNSVFSSSPADLQAQVQALIDNYNQQLHDWMVAHENESVGQLQQDFGNERNALNSALGNAVQALSNQWVSQGVSWDDINSANPWQVYQAYNNYADSLQQQTIDPQYNGGKPVVPPVPGGGGNMNHDKIDNDYNQAKNAAGYTALLSDYNKLAALVAQMSPAQKAEYDDINSTIQNLEDLISKLKGLDGLPTPSDENVTTAGQDLSNFQKVDLSGLDGKINDLLSALNPSTQNQIKELYNQVNTTDYQTMSANYTALKNLAAKSELTPDEQNQLTALEQKIDAYQKLVSDLSTLANNPNDGAAELTKAEGDVNGCAAYDAATLNSSALNLTTAIQNNNPSTQSQIQGLYNQVNTAAYQKMSNDYTALKNLAAKSELTPDEQNQLAALEKQIDAYQKLVNDLSTLANNSKDGSAELIKANADVQGCAAYDASTLDSSVLNLTSDIQQNPPPPPPPVGNVDHSAWVDNWTNDLDTDAYINSLANGSVKTLNVFVGQLDLVNGVPTIDGFTEDTPGRPAGTGAFQNIDELKDFVQKCKAKGISVKLSLGGAAGYTFGNSWNKLTDSNIDDFAKACQSICQETGAAGIDFDDELEDKDVGARAGKLAAALKQLDPQLQLSFCAYARIDWHPGDQAFMQNAMLPDGTSAISQVYVMAYGDGLNLQQNMDAMAIESSWLKDNCKITASQISCGVDPTDPNDDQYNQQWVQFAAKNGYGTAIFDNQGPDNYIQGNWGTKILNWYNAATPTPSNDYQALADAAYNRVVQEDGQQITPVGQQTSYAQIGDNAKSEAIHSESVGYKMLTDISKGDKAAFLEDAKFMASYLDNFGLMNWNVDPSGKLVAGYNGHYAATDADQDIAYAMMQGLQKWPDLASAVIPTTTIGFDPAGNNGNGAELPPVQGSTTLMDLVKSQLSTIWTREVGHDATLGTNNLLLDGDGWSRYDADGKEDDINGEYDPKHGTDLSYFRPSYYQTFQNFYDTYMKNDPKYSSENQTWYSNDPNADCVYNDMYQFLLNSMKNNPQCLPPDSAWLTTDGKRYQPGSKDGIQLSGYDAVRVPMWIAMDYAQNPNSPQAGVAKQILETLMGYYAEQTKGSGSFNIPVPSTGQAMTEATAPDYAKVLFDPNAAPVVPDSSLQYRTNGQTGGLVFNPGNPAAAACILVAANALGSQYKPLEDTCYDYLYSNLPADVGGGGDDNDGTVENIPYYAGMLAAVSGMFLGGNFPAATQFTPIAPALPKQAVSLSQVKNNWTQHKA